MGTGHLPAMTPQGARDDHRSMLRLLALNAMAGAGLGLLVAFCVLWFDVGGLGSLVSHSAQPALPILLLAGPLAMTFAAAVAGSAIMLMPYTRKFSDKRKD